MTVLGTAIKKSLKAQNMSQAELARAMKMSPNHVGWIILGKRRATAEVCYELARCLGGQPWQWWLFQKRDDLAKAREVWRKHGWYR